MTVRFARHGNKAEVDSAPSPSTEEWTQLRPVAFEVGGLCCILLRWTEAAPHCWSPAGRQGRRCEAAPVLSK